MSTKQKLTEADLNRQITDHALEIARLQDKLTESGEMRRAAEKLVVEARPYMRGVRNNMRNSPGVDQELGDWLTRAAAVSAS